MAELGYGELIPGIYGTPNPATDSDPVSRAALQEATIQAQIRRAAEPGYVPPTYAGPASVGPLNAQVGGPGNLPKIGWTAQNGNGSSPFVEQPGEWTAEDMGRIPQWETDRSPDGAGDYDMGGVYTGAFPPNPLGVAPIGDGLLQYEDVLNPNRPPNDVGGSNGELDY